jgi:hypothetical protein
VANTGGGLEFEWADLEFGLRGNVDAQLVTLRVVNELDDPYFAVLGESLPHLRFDGNIWKNFTTKVGTYGLQLGLRGRLLTEDQPTQFNRNYGNAYLLFDATDIGVSGPFVSAIFEYHFGLSDPEVGDDTLFTVGGSAGYEGKQFKGTVGTYFLRYKYDYYVDVQELTNVRGYFGEFRYDPLKWLSIRLRYELEQFDRDIHTLTFKLVQSF